MLLRDGTGATLLPLIAAAALGEVRWRGGESWWWLDASNGGVSNVCAVGEGFKGPPSPRRVESAEVPRRGASEEGGGGGEGARGNICCGGGDDGACCGYASCADERIATAPPRAVCETASLGDTCEGVGDGRSDHSLRLRSRPPVAAITSRPLGVALTNTAGL